MNKFVAILLILSSLVFGLVAIAALAATIMAFTARDTTAAVESLFGSSVITLMFTVLCLKTYSEGRKRLNDIKIYSSVKSE